MTTPANVTALTPELARLMEHERTIEQGLATFVDVGVALAAIRDGQMYQAKGFEMPSTRSWRCSSESRPV